MKKRLLACLMSVSMVFTLMYGSAVAAEGGGQEKIEEAQEKQEVSTPSDADQIVATGWKTSCEFRGGKDGDIDVCGEQWGGL